MGGEGFYEAARGGSFDPEACATYTMAARIEGFPGASEFADGKTVAYRQIGNAFCTPSQAEAEVP